MAEEFRKSWIVPREGIAVGSDADVSPGADMIGKSLKQNRRADSGRSGEWSGKKNEMFRVHR